MKNKILFFYAVIFININNSKAQNLFTSLPSSYTGIKFRNDVTEDAKLYYYSYQYLYNGGGVAVGDINNDGLPDIYLSSTRGSNKLYLNLGNFKFKDITVQAGVDGGPGIHTGVNMIDINNDGLIDILVCKSGPGDPSIRKKILYINNGNGTFTDKAKEFGLDDESYTTQAYFFDYDGDGDLDVFFTNHSNNFANANLVRGTMQNGKIIPLFDTAHQYVSNRLFENKNGKFIDVTAKAGLLNNGFGLSSAVFDFNNDGKPDIFLANDFNMPDMLYINNGDGTFKNQITNFFAHTTHSSMGCDFNDINNDGLEDLFVADMAAEDPIRQKQLYVQILNYDRFQMMQKFGLYFQYPRNVLQLNNGNNTFSDIAYISNTALTDWSWAPLIADFDNDGWKDLFVTNGFKRDVSDWDYKEFVLDSIKKIMASGQKVDLIKWFDQIPQVRIQNYFFKNNKTLKLQNVSLPWCNAPPSFSNGAAYADLDNDGDLDLIVNNIDDEAFVLKNNNNEINHNHYLRFRFYKSKNNKQEIYGAAVKITDEAGNIQFQHYNPQRGYMSTMEHVLHFGLGNKESIAKVEILFNNNKKIELDNVKTNQVINIYESEAIDIKTTTAEINKPFKQLNPQKIFTYAQIENEFIDFKREPLLPYKCSRKGPFFTKGDVNGDGLEDIFIGGASGQAAKLFIQNATGKFIEKIVPAFISDKNFEDNGCVLFDADGDGDLDLYVVSGGAEWEAGNELYQDRLYINDGKGNFIKSKTALPKENFNGNCVKVFDYDNDGDLDIFVGGGVLPGNFPKADQSFLLQNNNGIFKKVTDTVFPELSKLGIINNIEIADIDLDNQKEIILTGEWMGPAIFHYLNGKFIRVNLKINVETKNGNKIIIPDSSFTGWWNVAFIADVNNDGKPDIILGNRGNNSKITANIEEPCKIYAKDFDGNGSYDALLGYYIWGKCYPMYHRDQLIDQMPYLRKRFYRYHLYAGKTMDEIFTEKEKLGMDVYTASNFSSGILINKGQNNFDFEPFDDRAQFSTVNDLIYDDFDNDGKKDIVICGNNNDADVSTGNYDAMAILFLKGDGSGKFTPLSPAQSGLFTTGEARKLIQLNKKIIVLKNNEASVLFQHQ